MTLFRILCSALVLTIAGASLFAQENLGSSIIINGDFDQFDSGFETQYFYTQSASNFASPGYFTIKQNPRELHPLMDSCSDHTGNDGYMMIVNGYDRAVYLAWSQTVDNLVPNTEYIFSFFAMSTFFEEPAILKVVINDDSTSFQPINLTSSQCDWTEFRTTINSDDQSSFTFKIYDLKTGVNRGNDFALDDIELRPVCNLEMITSPDRTICRGGTVMLSCQPVGGFPPYKYEWFPKTGVEAPFADETEVFADSTRTYYVEITDSIGCVIRDSVRVNIMYPPDFVIQSSKESPICPCEEVNLAAPEGYTYFWSTNETSREITIDRAGDYSVRIMDAAGCVNSSTISFEYKNTDTEVVIGDMSARTGEVVRLPIHIATRNNSEICPGEDFTAAIRFNKTMLVPKERFNGKVEGNDQIIYISGNTNDPAAFEVPFIATLGNAECTEIALDSMGFECAEPEVRANTGKFCITNLCREPSERLFEDTGALAVSVTPNPASDAITIEFNAIEEGLHSIYIYNIYGEIILEPYSENISPGRQSLQLAVGGIPIGLYYLRLQTPSQSASVPLQIVR
ncbi:MAG: T9SS type A sorting domain-containing protein [Candidatus Kapaibacterium sp.]